LKRDLDVARARHEVLEVARLERRLKAIEMLKVDCQCAALGPPCICSKGTYDPCESVKRIMMRATSESAKGMAREAGR
jgi:hypothetical protein